jgi:hypothetical protein
MLIDVLQRFYSDFAGCKTLVKEDGEVGFYGFCRA